MLKSAALVVLFMGAIAGDPANLKPLRSIPEGAEISLTKLISSGNIAKAQETARVNPPLFDVKSFAHFFTVDEEYNSNIFFWYFPVTTNDPDAPLILWLQGGPGTSSMLGLFAENGPVSIDSSLKANPRDFAWNKKYNLLYFDNPVGAGFSYTEHQKGYATNLDDVGANLYAALIQFLQLFPELQRKPFFITGESYAGKWIPTLGHFIHRNNPTATVKVNLTGIAIGNGFTDPPNMLDYSNHFYQIGLIDDAGKRKFELKEAEIKSFIAHENWPLATWSFAEMMISRPVMPFDSLFRNLTGFFNVYNYLNQNQEVRYWIRFVNQPRIKNLLHVYDQSFQSPQKVKYSLIHEIMKSAKPWVEELLTAYRVLIYTGQLDCVVPSKQVHDYTKKLIFPEMIQYRLARRSKWWVGDKIAGYVKTAGRLTDVVVRDAGHMVPEDQPAFAWDLIDRFVYDKKFSDSP